MSLIEVACCILFFIKITQKAPKHSKECCMVECFRLSKVISCSKINVLEMSVFTSLIQVRGKRR